MWEVTALKDKITTALIALPVSWLLAWSAMNAMTTGLNLPVDRPGLPGWVWLLCALTGCILFSFHTGTLLGVSCSIAAVYWLWNAWGISKPIRALITRLSVIYDSAYHWGVLEFAGIDWQTTSLDLLLMVWGGIIALAAAAGIDGMENVCIFSIGSDGTDGPTDAAGGYVDGTTAGKLRSEGISISQILKHNDAYHALEKTGGLVITGPTGTNVNDVAVLLMDS